MGTRGLDEYTALQENNACHVMKTVGGLVVTGPGNVNDMAAALLDVGRRS
ncbi:hypothetical protein [uncultured Oscillibacter sp.]|nr:hypothetical protein [uncultured Oscillibacter sp.]